MCVYGAMVEIGGDGGHGAMQEYDDDRTAWRVWIPVANCRISTVNLFLILQEPYKAFP